MGNNNFNDDVKEKILRDIRETDNKYSKKIKDWVIRRHSLLI